MPHSVYSTFETTRHKYTYNNYVVANDILFNPLKSVCIVYKPKYYKLFCPSVNIRSEPLRFVNKTKYLCFTFGNLNKDDKYMTSVYYARSKRLLCMFSHSSIDVKENVV